MSYSVPTLKKLFALSGNQCAYPDCSAPIIDGDSGIVVGEICHIKGKNPGGPRYDPNQSDEERNSYENLLLMCDPHNKVVDHKETRHNFPSEKLQEYKRNHEERFRRKLTDYTYPGDLKYNLVNQDQIGRFVQRFFTVDGDRWRRMVTTCERKYKSGKEPGVSFAEIIQRQPEYLEMEPFLSPEAMSALNDDRAGKKREVGMVDGKEFVNPPDRLKSILAREIAHIELSSHLGEGLLKQTQSQLEIIFNRNEPGFIQSFRAESVDGRREEVDWKLYRVSISSPVTAVTRLKIDHIKLEGGDEYSHLFLRVMGDPTVQEFTLHPGVPHFWDVVEKPACGEWVVVTHAVKTVRPFLLRTPCKFKISASCDQGFGISKLVMLEVDRANNNELEFQISDG
jgi:hypothetical protein